VDSLHVESGFLFVGHSAKQAGYITIFHVASGASQKLEGHKVLAPCQHFVLCPCCSCLPGLALS